MLKDGRFQFGLASVISLVTFVSWPVGAHARIADLKSASISASTVQAGAHPDWEVEVAFENPTPFTSPEWIVFERFPGWLNPRHVTRCSAADFAIAECPPASQVGLMTLEGSYEGSQQVLGTAPLYSIVTSDTFGELGFWVPLFDAPVTSTFGPRPVESSLRWILGPLPEEAAISSLKAELWGIPADPGHDPSRFPTGSLGSPSGCPGIVGTSCIVGTASGESQVPFTINPTQCTISHVTDIKAWSLPEEKESPGEWHTTSPGNSGCSQLSFDPTAEIVPTTTIANEFSGLDLKVTVPQPLSATEYSPAELISAEFQLPPEFELATELPPGLVSCSQDEAGFFTEVEEACPSASIVGTASVDLSIAPGPLVGNIFLGTPAPNGSERLFFFPSGYGLRLKRVLALKVDEATGDLIASFVQPEMPIEGYELHVFGGEDGLFVTPIYCGDFAVPMTFESWAGTTRHSNGTFSIDAGPNGAPCLGGARTVKVELEPGTIPADGHSLSTVYVAVLDEHGTPIPGEFLKLSSSDAGQHLSSVSELGDGIYEATITASSTPGISTITATDLTAESELSGSAQLDQLETRPVEVQSGSKASGPTHSTGPSAPIVRISRRPPRRSFGRRPKFSFHVASANASFECALDKAPFQLCSSPLTLPRLTVGRHRFRVRARMPGGVAGSPTIFRFTVLCRPHEKMTKPLRHRDALRLQLPGLR